MGAKGRRRTKTCKQRGYVSDDSLLKYVTQDGERLYALNDSGPVGDGFYANPGSRYMGIANRPATMSCGNCSMVGFCQYCTNRWPTQTKT